MQSPNANESYFDWNLNRNGWLKRFQSVEGSLNGWKFCGHRCVGRPQYLFLRSAGSRRRVEMQFTE